MNGRSARLRLWGELPQRYASQKIAASTVDASGRLVALLAEPATSNPRRAQPLAPYHAVAVVMDGTDITEIVLDDLDYPYSMIDTVDDGFVLVTARCNMPSQPPGADIDDLTHADIPLNGRIINPDGTTRATFHAGDALEHLLTDRAGNIWTGYFDEASIFALWTANAPQRKQAPQRVSMSLPGLIRWTPTGEPAWYAAFDDTARSWMDCYALNVGDQRTWAYTYTGFPLIDIDHSGVRCVRRTPTNGASGIAVAGDNIAFLGRYDDPRDQPGHYTVTFGRIIDGPVEPITTAPLLLPDGSPPPGWARKKICRDNRIWLQFDNPRTWYMMEI